MAAAVGGNAAASGSNAVAFGGNSQASGNGSVALGGNSSATADNSVALGANSVADEANTVSVGSAGNERRVTNVAPGVNGTDATNVNQLNALRNDVSSSMTQLRRAALGGVAAAMAMPNLMPSSPGKTIVGAGVANYKGYNAIAAGATYRSENNRWLVNGAVSVTQNGDAGVRAQAGYEF
jgi:autotransporter adhesin